MVIESGPFEAIDRKRQQSQKSSVWRKYEEEEQEARICLKIAEALALSIHFKWACKILGPLEL